MTPAPERAGTGYLLAHAGGSEFVAYQNDSQGEFWIDLKSAPGTYAVEWCGTTAGKTTQGKPIQGSGWRVLTTPFPGPAAVYLKRFGGR